MSLIKQSSCVIISNLGRPTKAHKLSSFPQLTISDLENLLPELEETYTSSLFMTEPLYQFYDKDTDQLYDKGSSEGSHSSEQMDEEDDGRDEEDEEDGEERSGEENMYESVENLLSLPSIRASLRKTRASRFLLDSLLLVLLLVLINHPWHCYVSQVLCDGHCHFIDGPQELMGRTARGGFAPSMTSGYHHNLQHHHHLDKFDTCVTGD